MKNRQALFYVILLIVSSLASAQIIGFETIDTTNVTPWIAKSENDYQSVYHFGDSELESDFLLIRGNNQWYGQIKSGIWAEGGNTWICKYENLTNVRIKGNRFLSDQTDGEFVNYKYGQSNVNGLKIYKSWSGLAKNGEYEIGTKSYPVAEYFKGKFPQASMRILTNDEVGKIPKADLKIMRNEIFARYGYRFKAGEPMDTYFRAQEWYVSHYDNVDSLLTEIERTNIKKIKFFESK